MGICDEPGHEGSCTTRLPLLFFFSLTADFVDDSQRPDLRCIPDPETILRVSIQLVSAEIWNLSAFLTVTGLH